MSVNLNDMLKSLNQLPELKNRTVSSWESFDSSELLNSTHNNYSLAHNIFVRCVKENKIDLLNCCLKIPAFLNALDRIEFLNGECPVIAINELSFIFEDNRIFASGSRPMLPEHAETISLLLNSDNLMLGKNQRKNLLDWVVECGNKNIFKEIIMASCLSREEILYVRMRVSNYPKNEDFIPCLAVIYAATLDKDKDFKDHKGHFWKWFNEGNETIELLPSKFLPDNVIPKWYLSREDLKIGLNYAMCHNMPRVLKTMFLISVDCSLLVELGNHYLSINNFEEAYQCFQKSLYFALDKEGADMALLGLLHAVPAYRKGLIPNLIHAQRLAYREILDSIQPKLSILSEDTKNHLGNLLERFLRKVGVIKVEEKNINFAMLVEKFKQYEININKTSVIQWELWKNAYKKGNKAKEYGAGAVMIYNQANQKP